MPPGRPPIPYARTRQVLTALALSACCAAFAQAPAVQPADDYAPIAQMLRAGRAAEALARTDQLLTTRPRDPQLQFLRAQALAGTDRAADAIAAYLQITREYPELAEPHNNLAVLYAARNELASARAALEAALRANPAYVTAHENLGDILLRLAVESWARARQLEPGLATVGPKLAAARSLIDATTPALRARAPASAASRPASAAR
ncbi:MAG: hypothetical protein RIS88_1011 [Pseudomonadota bacterium]|jgi:Flp pilus assembly protein TadD